MDRLADMLQAQRALQVDSFGLDPCALEGEELAEFIRWNQQALVAETFEMLDEVGWKPWASSRHVNVDPLRKEMVDAIHFFMNILLAAHGPDVLEYGETWLSDLFYLDYLSKREVNAERQANGYDGLSGKCPKCHRDRDETKLTDESAGYRTVYCPCGHVYENGLIV